MEGNETFQLMIQPTNPLDMVSPGGNTTTVTIVDDDGKHYNCTTTLGSLELNTSSTYSLTISLINTRFTCSCT